MPDEGLQYNAKEASSNRQVACVDVIHVLIAQDIKASISWQSKNPSNLLRLSRPFKAVSFVARESLFCFYITSKLSALSVKLSRLSVHKASYIMYSLDSSASAGAFGCLEMPSPLLVIWKPSVSLCAVHIPSMDVCYKRL